MLKTRESKSYKAFMKIKTRRRICLTGTPFQNNLLEYYHMVSFIRPNLLESERNFQKKFIEPIQSSMGSDTLEDVKTLADKRLTELVNILDPHIHRRDASLLRNDLPHLQNVCLYVPPTKLQRALYKAFREHQEVTNERNFLKQYASLRTVHNHPGTLLFLEEQNTRCRKVSTFESRKEDTVGKHLENEKISEVPSIKKEPTEANIPERCNQTSQESPDADVIIDISSSDDEEDERDERYPTNSLWWTRVAEKFGSSDMKRIERCASNLWKKRNTVCNKIYVTTLTTVRIFLLFDIKSGNKCIILLHMLAHTSLLGEKTVIFSQSLKVEKIPY